MRLEKMHVVYLNKTTQQIHGKQIESFLIHDNHFVELIIDGFEKIEVYRTFSHYCGYNEEFFEVEVLEVSSPYLANYLCFELKDN